MRPAIRPSGCSRTKVLPISHRANAPAEIGKSARRWSFMSMIDYFLLRASRADEPDRARAGVQGADQRLPRHCADAGGPRLSLQYRCWPRWTQKPATVRIERNGEGGVRASLKHVQAGRWD